MDSFNKNKYKFSNSPTMVDVSEETIIKRTEQIEAMSKELFLYKVLIKDLYSHKPMDIDKNILLNVAFYIIHDVELLAMFQDKKILPFTRLSRLTKLPRNYLEKWQDYIIIYIVIFSNPNYKYIQDYLKVEEIKEEEKEKSEIKYEENKDLKIFDGIVLHRTRFSTFILRSNGDFVKVKNIEGTSIGEDIQSSERIGFRHIKYKLAAVLLIFLIIGIGLYVDYNKTVRTIIIESTSKIKLSTNRYEKIVYKYSESEKGKNMLEFACADTKDTDDVIKRCIEYANENEMIPTEGLVITVIGKAIEYGKLEKTGDYIVDNNIKLLINNAGNQHKLYEIIVKEKENKKNKE